LKTIENQAAAIIHIARRRRCHETSFTRQEGRQLTMRRSGSKTTAGVMLTLMAALTASCGVSNEDELASSTLGVVTRSDLDQYILELPEETRRPGKGQDPIEWRIGMLRRLMANRALRAEADRLGLMEDKAAVAELDLAREQIVLASALQRYVTPRATPTDEELRRYYEAHPEEFGHPEQIRLRHIFRHVAIEAPDGDRAAAREEMEQLLARLREGAHFGDLAREYSDSETAQLQGLIGRLSRGQLDASVEEIVWRLGEGEISDVVATPVGFHIFKLEDHLEPFTMDFEEARGRLLRRLTRLARDETMADIESELLTQSGAEYRPELVRAGRPEPDAVLFALGDFVVTGADLESYRAATGFAELRNLPPALWLEQTCRNRLLIWRAETDGLDSDPKVAAQIEQSSARISESRAFNRRLEEKIRALEGAGVLEDYYEQNILRFKSPKLHHLRLITLDFDRFERPYDALQLLDTVARESRAGTRDFAESARELSDDLSAADGGDLGWVTLNRFVEWAGPRAMKLVTDLQEGEISEPFITEEYVERQLRYDRTGFALVKVEEIRPSEVRSYEESRDHVVRRYRKSYQGELEEQIVDDLLESIAAEIFEERL
jgi:parvulin-like peptidyl-prolyl isomerase